MRILSLLVSSTMKCAIFEENGNTHNLQRALSHATVLNAVRRMGDFVLTSCAANALQPYKQNDNGWDQGQIFFTPSQVWGMPPFYAQKMASENHLPYRVKQASRGVSLDVTATTDEKAQNLVIHVVNSQNIAVNQRFDIQNFNIGTKAEAQILTGGLDDRNSPEEPEKISPQPFEIQLDQNGFTNTFPANSYTIIRLVRNDASSDKTLKSEINIQGKKGGVLISCNEIFMPPQVNIYSMQGFELFSGIQRSNRFFYTLTNGTYIVSIKDSNMIKTEKVLVI